MGKTTCHITRIFILQTILFFFIGINALSQSFCLSDILYSRDAIDEEQFGYSIAISGDYAIIGSRSEETDSNGQNKVSNAGAVYFYKKNADGKWEMTQKLVPSDRIKNDYFGHSVSISGNLAVVGAIGKDNPENTKKRNVGVVYLCQLGSDGKWTIIKEFFASDMAEDAELGYSVSISNERIMSGAPEEEEDENGRNSIDKAGAVYVFERRWWGAWTQTQKIVSPERRKNDYFGESLSILGDVALIGSFKHNEDDYKEAGAVYAYARNYWSGYYFENKLDPPDYTEKGHFGHSIHISDDYAIIGAYGDDKDPNGGIQVPGAGSALVYKHNSGDGWEYVQKIIADDRNDDDRFGWSVNMSKDFAFVGAINKDIVSNTGSLVSKAGAAYVFQRNGSDQWSQVDMLALEDPDRDDKLGSALAYTNGSLFVSSPTRDKPESSNEDAASKSGAVFIFQKCQDITVTVDTSICDGDSIWLEGAYRKDPGSYSDIYPLPTGIDSIVITNLFILPNSITNIELAICSGDSIWIGGAFRHHAGIYYDTFDAYNGCDSIIITELFITPLSTTTVEESICQGDSIWLGGAFRSVAGIYYDTIPQTSGCAEVLITELSITPLSSSSVTESICQGDSIWLGGDFRSVAGIYYDTIPQTSGCAEVLITDLRIIPSTTTHADTTICEGTSIFLEGNYQTTPGTYYDTIPGVNACDSVVITELSITPLSTNTIQISICPGDSIWLVGSYKSVPGTYYDTLSNPAGCDRVMITILSHKSVSVTNIETRICSGDSIWLEGEYQSTPGTYYDSLTGINGCDSIIISTLTVSEGQSYTIPQIRSICKGDSIWLQNAYQKTAGIYIDTTIIEPCGDTLLYETTLNAYPLAEIELGADTTLCDNETILLDAGGGFESYDWNNGFATTQTIIADMAGSYSVIATDVNGCTDTDEIIISFKSCPTSVDPGSDKFEILIYPNPTTGLLHINMGDKYSGKELHILLTNMRGQIVITKKVNNESEFSLDLSRLSKGMYYLNIRNSESAISTKIILK